MPNPNLPAWTRLLVLAGGRVAVWSSPTERYFLSSPAHRPEPEATGWTRLAEAIKAGAEQEAAHRLAARHPDAHRTPTTLEKKAILWETQPTSDYHHAPRRVQLALEVAMTTINPVRATFAQLRDRGPK